MEVKSSVRQVTVFDAPTAGSFTVKMPDAEGFMTVSGPTGYVVAKQLKGLFPDYEFIYEKDASYIWDTETDRLVRDKVASKTALFDAGTALLEQTLHQIRREINIALDENRQPDYQAYIDRITSAFGTADKYFWILEGRLAAPKTATAKPVGPAPKVRPPQWPKPSSDYDADADWKSKYYKDILAKGLTKHTLPFGVGYSFDGDINDIEKLTKELEAIFKGFRR